MYVSHCVGVEAEDNAQGPLQIYGETAESRCTRHLLVIFLPKLKKN
jgi:hypothetical protein